MSIELTKMAKKAAKQSNLVYAPDIDAMIWMQRFAEMVALHERELCAQLCDKWGIPELAETIRERKKK
jgi:hypothetical protein